MSQFDRQYVDAMMASAASVANRARRRDVSCASAARASQEMPL